MPSMHGRGADVAGNLGARPSGTDRPARPELPLLAHLLQVSRPRPPADSHHWNPPLRHPLLP